MLTDKSKCQRSSLKHPGSRRIKKAFFVLHSSFFQDQAPTALWINNHPPIQDQAPTALEESVLRSSFIVLPRSSPDGPWINHPPIQDQAPTTLEESTIVHHQFIQDQAPTALWINKRRQIHTSNRSLRSSPKALEDPFITVLKKSSPKALGDPFVTVLQRSSPKAPLKIRSNPPSRSSPRPLENVHPISSLDDPWINETSTNTHLTEIESEDQNRERL
ncbi:hypothetical protein ACFX15_012382 [Malus domestica]